MGAKLAQPDKLCINVWGDAAIGFTGMDFETAVRERIPILSILMNNFSMAIELPIMQVATEKYRSTDISGNYADMAKAFGGYGERITEPGEISAGDSDAASRRPESAARAARVHHGQGDHDLPRVMVDRARGDRVSAVSHLEQSPHAFPLAHPIPCCQHENGGRECVGQSFENFLTHFRSNQENPIHRPEAATVNQMVIEHRAVTLSAQGLMLS